VFRDSAMRRALARNRALRRVWQFARGTPPVPGRRRIPSSLGVEGLFDALRREGARYVVLRWFEDLPHVAEGEDVDVLVSDEHAPLLDRLLTRSPDAGGVLCDVYSESGRPGFRWKNTAYFPPHLAAEVLARGQPHPSGALVPCPEDHFRTLAFHALYHKGYDAGLPVDDTEGPGILDPEHDYLERLRALSEELGIVVGLDMRSLDQYLDAIGWRPPVDTLAKWSPFNTWAGELHQSLTSGLRGPPGLVVCLVRQRAADADALRAISRITREHGFVQVALEPLPSDAIERASRVLRGGDWGRGPYPLSGGPPTAALVAVDPAPQAPTAAEQLSHPGLDNGRLLPFKAAVRDWWNDGRPAPDACNILHTSDNVAHAIHYLEVALPRSSEELLRRAAAVHSEPEVFRRSRGGDLSQQVGELAPRSTRSGRWRQP
jgi:hypothetical protein